MSAVAHELAELRRAVDLLRVTLLGGELDAVRFEGKFPQLEVRLGKVEERLTHIEQQRMVEDAERKTAIRWASAIGTGIGGVLTLLGEFGISMLRHR